MSSIDRSNYIGGSDAGALMGQNEYKTVRDVWDKLRGNKEVDLSDNNHVKRGNAIEPIVVEWIQKNLDPTLNSEGMFELFDVGDETDQIFLRDPKKDFIGGHPDGMGWGDPTTEEVVVYEIKAPTSRTLDRLKRYGIHARYYWQVMHYMMIVNRGQYSAERAVMVLWDYDKWKPLFVNVWFDEEKANELFQRCKDMHFAAEAGFVPEFDNITEEEMRLYDGNKPMAAMLEEYYQVKEDIKTQKDRKDQLKSKILSALDGEECIQTPNHRADIKYDWGRYDSTRLTVSER